MKLFLYTILVLGFLSGAIFLVMNSHPWFGILVLIMMTGFRYSDALPTKPIIDIKVNSKSL